MDPEPIGVERGLQMLIAAINDEFYSIDPENQINGLAVWVKGERLNAYRGDHNPPYPSSPNNGWDWHDAEEELRRQGHIAKYRLPNGRVFFVLPAHQGDFQALYQGAVLV